MASQNVVGRVIIAGFEPRSEYVGTLKVTYEYNNHCITFEEAGEKKQFSTGRRGEPWKFRTYTINFGGEQHEDCPTEAGGRRPNPFVDFEIMVDVPAGRIKEDAAKKAGIAAAKRFFPAAKVSVAYAHYLPTVSQWEVLVQTEGDPPGQKRVFFDAVSGEEHRVGNFIRIEPKREILLQESDIAQQTSASWTIELISEKDRPVLVYTDDYGARHLFPVTKEGEEISAGYFGIKILGMGRTRTAGPSETAGNPPPLAGGLPRTKTGGAQAGDIPESPFGRTGTGMWFVSLLLGPPPRKVR